MTKIKTFLEDSMHTLMRAYEQAIANGKSPNNIFLSDNPLNDYTKDVYLMCKHYFECKCKVNNLHENDKRIYRNFYSWACRTCKRKESEDMEKFLHDFIGNSINKIFQEIGIEYAYVGYGKYAYKLQNRDRLWTYVFENIIKPKLEAKGLKGVKALKTASVLSQRLFDFSEAYIDKKEKVE